MPYTWLNRHWVAAALCMGIVLLLLAPVLRLAWEPALLLIFLQTPIYMLHQVEEHTGERFKHFVNEKVFGGLPVMTAESILWINIPGVWGVTLLSLYAAAFIGLGWGLAAVYLVLVNAVGHLAGSIATRAYNPGLWTSLALFLPVGGYALWCASANPTVTVTHHLTGLAIALAVHAAILIHAKVRKHQLTVGRSQSLLSQRT